MKPQPYGKNGKIAKKKQFTSILNAMYVNEELQPLNVRAKYLSTMYDLKKKINEMNQELLRSLGKEVLNETILLKLDRGLFHEWINEYRLLRKWKKK